MRTWSLIVRSITSLVRTESGFETSMTSTSVLEVAVTLDGRNLCLGAKMINFSRAVTPNPYNISVQNYIFSERVRTSVTQWNVVFRHNWLKKTTPLKIKNYSPIKKFDVILNQ